MNKELISSMRDQLVPDPAAVKDLYEKLEAVTPARRQPVWAYGALAACAALAILAWPKAAPDVPAKLHSYVVVSGGETIEGEFGYVKDAAAFGSVDVGVASTTEGDHDIAMSPLELGEQMENYGFSPEDAEAYMAAGYHMTWATWWKYSDEPSLDRFIAFTEENSEWIDRIIADYGLPPVNTGDMVYSGAYAGEELPDADVDAAAQWPAVEAYEKLMKALGSTYPDWYGGAYVDKSNLLIIQVTGETATDKEMLLKIADMAGGNNAVGFGDAKYSMKHLLDLQKEVETLPEMKALPWWGCGVQDDLNKLVLDLPAEATEDQALLAALAELDPADDAILVHVSGQSFALETAPDITPVGAQLSEGENVETGLSAKKPGFAIAE